MKIHGLTFTQTKNQLERVSTRDGIPDLMVKFDRASVIEYIMSNIDWSSPERTKPLIYEVTLTVSGMLYDGTLFEGSDTVRLLKFLNGHPEPK